MSKFVIQATMDGIMKYENKEKFKLERKSAGRMKVMWIWIALALIAVAAGGCVSKTDDRTKNETPATPVANSETLIQEKIKSKLIGMEITYYGIAGNALIYNVTENDIKMINESLLENEKVWKVSIGEGISWDYYFNEKGDNIVKTVQLFRT